MHITLDNIIFSLQKAGGISIYWYEMISRFLKKGSDITFYESANSNIFRDKLNLNTFPELIKNTRILRYLPFTGKTEKYGIFHSSYYRTALTGKSAKIVTVYDFTYEYYRRGSARTVHSIQKNSAIRNADGVICISESTKKDLLKFLPDIDPDKVKTIHISAGNEFRTLEKVNVLLTEKFSMLDGKKIILFVGDRKSGYKNFKTAAEAVSGIKGCTLVTVGAGSPDEEEINYLRSILDGRFYHFSSISSEELNILYNAAFCLLYPSSYEGFGIPVLEAMKAGCPVVSTDVSSIPEVAGTSAVLVKTPDAESLAAAVKSLDNADFRKCRISEGLAQSASFSWDKCFNETVGFYKEVTQRKFGK